MKNPKEDSAMSRAQKVKMRNTQGSTISTASAAGTKTGKMDSTTRQQLISTARNPTTDNGPSGDFISSIAKEISRSLSSARGTNVEKERPTLKYHKNMESMKLSIGDHSDETPITLKISSKMETRIVYVQSNMEMLVKDFKDKFFEKEINLEGLGVRLIHNGKEMRDSHKLSDHSLQENAMIYVFFFKKEDKVRKDTSMSMKAEADFNNITDTEGLDFDYYKERQNLTEEEVLWKRFCFHAPYIYRADIPVISDPVLFKREYDFMREFGDKRHDPDQFRLVIFKGFSVSEFIRERTATFLVLLVVGLLLGFPSTLILPLKVKASFKVAVLVGAMVNMTVDYLLRLFWGVTMYSWILGRFNYNRG